MLEIPFFIYPTQLLILEDDIEFAEVVKNAVSNNLIYPSICPTYQDFLNFIQKNISHNINESFSYIDEISYEEHHVSFSLSHLNKFLDEQEKNKPFSILIIDHNMPEKNGLEILEGLETLKLKKILLTGTVNDSQALKAFNNKRIDAFIPKQTLHLYKELDKRIKSLYFDFFIHLSLELLPLYNINSISSPIFKSKDFKIFFNNFLEEKSIISYRTLGLRGLFKLKDRNKKNYIFACISEEDFDFYKENGEENNIPQVLINEVIKKKAIPFALKEDKPFLSLKEWRQPLKKIKEVKINQSVFYIIFFEEMIN